MEKVILPRAKYPQFNNTKKRYGTFAEHWPVCYHIKPIDLAMAGFFYTQTGDKCCCWSCGITLSQWTMGDTPFREHLLHNPECGYVQMAGPLNAMNM